MYTILKVFKMRKTCFIIGIFVIFLSMPAIIAMQSVEKTSSFSNPEKTLIPPAFPEYDGTFLGGMGEVYKDENGEWQFDTHAYIAGAYKSGRYLRVFSNIYNLDEEQIGSMWFISGKRIILGRIWGLEGEKLPIVGFLFYNEQYFIGRIMSFFGPAPHIWGEYIPN